MIDILLPALAVAVVPPLSPETTAAIPSFSKLERRASPKSFPQQAEARAGKQRSAATESTDARRRPPDDGNTEELYRELDGFRCWYNHIRPHQGIDGLTPGEAWDGLKEPRTRGQPEFFEEWDGKLTGFW